MTIEIHSSRFPGVPLKLKKTVPLVQRFGVAVNRLVTLTPRPSHGTGPFETAPFKALSGQREGGNVVPANPL